MRSSLAGCFLVLFALSIAGSAQDDALYPCVDGKILGSCSVKNNFVLFPICEPQSHARSFFRAGTRAMFVAGFSYHDDAIIAPDDFADGGKPAHATAYRCDERKDFPEDCGPMRALRNRAPGTKRFV